MSLPTIEEIVDVQVVNTTFPKGVFVGIVKERDEMFVETYLEDDIENISSDWVEVVYGQNLMKNDIFIHDCNLALYNVTTGEMIDTSEFIPKQADDIDFFNIDQQSSLTNQAKDLLWQKSEQ